MRNLSNLFTFIINNTIQDIDNLFIFLFKTGVPYYEVFEEYLSKFNRNEQKQKIINVKESFEYVQNE